MRRTAIAKLAVMALAVSAASAARPAGAETLYTLTDLGTLPGGPSSLGLAVDESGQVAGFSDIVIAGNLADHAFMSGPGGGPLKDLGTLPGGADSVGAAVNSSGLVAGYSDTGGSTPSQDAFLYSGGQLLDLNSLIAPGSGVTLTQADGISDTGYITGSGTTPNGLSHAFLLIPTAIPEPSALVLLGTGAVVPFAWPRRPQRAVTVPSGCVVRVAPAGTSRTAVLRKTEPMNSVSSSRSSTKKGTTTWRSCGSAAGGYWCQGYRRVRHTAPSTRRVHRRCGPSRRSSWCRARVSPGIPRW
jgi:probable HAF family extracellular repeat protein